MPQHRVKFKPATVPGGGGGGGTANVTWGPDFGESSDDNTFTVGASLTMPSLVLENNMTVGAQITMPELVANYNTQTVGANISMPEVVANYNTQTVGVNVTMPELVAEFPNATIGANVTFPEMVAENTKEVSAHLSGTALGAPFWQSEGHTTVANTDTIDIPYPSGIQAGDLLVAFVGSKGVSGPSNIFLPTGWTAIENNTNNAVGVALSATSLYKIADGTETGNLTVTLTDIIVIAFGEMHRVIGINPTTPKNVSAPGTIVATGLNPDPPSPTVTTTSINCLVFSFLLHDHGALSNTHTPPAGFTEVLDYQASIGSVFIASHTMYKVFPATGATGTAIHDCTETVSTSGIMHRVAIAPGEIILAS